MVNVNDPRAARGATILNEPAASALQLPSTSKHFREGTDRAVPPEETLARARPLMERLGITRIANITGLDRIGIPVVAVQRPNSRSLSVSQGKGATLVAAQVSGLMESIESYHAEHVQLPLLHGSYREMHDRQRVVNVQGLARLSVSCFHPDVPMLWLVGTDLISGKQVLVPYELVHTDFRVPLPTGSGAFVMSSNGLASGNHITEALSHAICELVERDANTLWHYSGTRAQQQRQLDLATVDDDNCREVLKRFDSAGVDVIAWETTGDVGICSYLCTIVDKKGCADWPMLPVSGSGCHPKRAIALLRALTEAAQGRLTLISGSRDDLSEKSFNDAEVRSRSAKVRENIEGTTPSRTFQDAPDREHDTFDADVQWELESLIRAGIHEAIAVNLSHPDVDIPVVRVVIPYLETMSELRGFVPGVRARKVMTEALQ